MFENIGSKIKSLAKVICWIGIICSVITAIVLFVNGDEKTVSIGFGVLIGGPLVSWISCMFTYGFGELIDKATEIAQNTSDGKKKSNTIKTDDKRIAELDKWRAEGLISEEDYQRKKGEL